MKYKYNEILTAFSLLLLAFVIRSYKVENGKFVTWDEAHFGKFSEKYLSRSFYFDVHPPLGKMLTALSGWFYEQPVGFKFESSQNYPEDFDYSGMRRFHALVASFTPMFSYLILRELRYSYRRSLLITLLFIFENGFTSIGRLILLDSYMLSFTALVAYFLTRLYFRSFGTRDLFYLGISLGMVLSVKWIGCLTTAFVGILIIKRLWCDINSKKPLVDVLKDFIRFAICLILVPAVFYVLLFYVHFKIVNNSSPDEGHMSSIFQASLNGNAHIKNRKYVSFGTRVTIKAQVQGGGYLHSHDHVYPGTSMNQITTYSHKDENNNWVFQKVTDDKEEARFIRNGDKVVLYHLETQRYLNMTDTGAYLSEGLLASASERPLTYKNVFIIEFYKDTKKDEEDLKSITTLFRIKHEDTGAYLRVSNEKYPSWGFDQGEVAGTLIKNDDTIWNIEENISDKIPEEQNPVYDEIYRSLFFRNLIEHNIVMYKTNKSFVQDDDLEQERIVSKPYEWPILRRGLRMCSWDDKHLKFYMFGNPLVWYTSLICVLVAPIKFILRILKAKRNGTKIKFTKNEGFEIFLTLGGWLFHYIPFFFVGRVLYFHHYYPALFFSMFSIAYVTKKISIVYLKIYVLACIVSYLVYSGLTYGFVNKTMVSKFKILPTWDFVE
ncbi:Dolichyl-phosphate-mannose--protein mannosyltransferase 6 [Nosema granulosis]|uniref:Dolichyl-phosphate-mannose--protein mannosyltransferase n=1 Tax=Nosema granulosis TaxID=83296 RepID=A0A9P6KYC7_9MICR|nr:Dolichyl-phosphate-mannose--protein mannosyltransferase 6 [Nosema granulosis]